MIVDSCWTSLSVHLMHKKFVLCTVWFPTSNTKITTTVSEILNFSKKKEMGIEDWSPIGLLLSGIYYYLKMYHRPFGGPGICWRMPHL